MIFLGHVSAWFLGIILMMVFRVIKFKGEVRGIEGFMQILVFFLIASIVLAIPSCTLQIVFFK